MNLSKPAGVEQNVWDRMSENERCEFVYNMGPFSKGAYLEALTPDQRAAYLDWMAANKGGRLKKALKIAIPVVLFVVVAVALVLLGWWLYTNMDKKDVSAPVNNNVVAPEQTTAQQRIQATLAERFDDLRKRADSHEHVERVLDKQNAQQNEAVRIYGDRVNADRANEREDRERERLHWIKLLQKKSLESPSCDPHSAAPIPQQHNVGASTQIRDGENRLPQLPTIVSTPDNSSAEPMGRAEPTTENTNIVHPVNTQSEELAEIARQQLEVLKNMSTQLTGIEAQGNATQTMVRELKSGGLPSQPVVSTPPASKDIVNLHPVDASGKCIGEPIPAALKGSVRRQGGTTTYTDVDGTTRTVPFQVRESVGSYTLSGVGPTYELPLVYGQEPVRYHQQAAWVEGDGFFLYDVNGKMWNVSRAAFMRARRVN